MCFFFPRYIYIYDYKYYEYNYNCRGNNIYIYIYIYTRKYIYVYIPNKKQPAKKNEYTCGKNNISRICLKNPLKLQMNLSQKSLTWDIKVGQFMQEELNSVLKKIKNRKAAGLNEIPLEVWKTRKFDDILLLRYCNDIYN